jgi:hypothetical protein
MAIALNSYYQAATSYQSHMSSGNQESLAFEFKQLQNLYQTALKQARPADLEHLKKRNTEILILSRGVIVKHLETCDQRKASLQAEMAQAASRSDTVVKTAIRVNCPIPLAGRITIHGQGNQLDWPRGTPLRQLNDGTVGFESTGALEYKLKMDGKWEDIPGNRTIAAGQTETITPALTLPIAPVKLTSRQVTQSDNLYLRGEGTVKINGTTQHLNWGKGIPLQRVGNEFFLMLDEPADISKFKLLINDDSNRWSEGPDWSLKKGENIAREVVFPGPAVEAPRIGAGRVAYNDQSSAPAVAQLGTRVTNDIVFDY